MPVNMLLIRALLNFYGFYGDSFMVECPTGSGRQMNMIPQKVLEAGKNGASACPSRGPKPGTMSDPKSHAKETGR